MIESAVLALQYQVGLYICGYSNKDWMSVEEIEEVLRDTALPSILNESQTRLLFQEAFEHIDSETGIKNRLFQETKLYVSLGVKLPLKCAIYRTLKKDVKIFGLISVLVMSVWIYRMYWKQERIKRIKAKRVVYDLIKEWRIKGNDEISAVQLRRRLVEADLSESLLCSVERELRNSPWVMVIFRDGVNSYRLR
jgi:hypothetical protein